jgi:hypothetical protein
MVKTIVAAIVVAGSIGLAHADAYDEHDEYGDVEDTEPAFNMLGFRTSFGALPLHGTRTSTFSLGLGVEHPVFRKTRVLGEYEWLWLFGDRSGRAMETIAAGAERYGNGHRMSVGLRRELVGVTPGRNLRVFVDAELGGSLALASHNVDGLLFVPAGFIGLRLGYDIYSRSDDSPSSTFEVEMLVRAITIAGGTGVMFGVGMLWGN